MAEASISSTHLVPQLIGRGWPLLAEVAPAAAAVVTPLAWDPGPLVAALARPRRRSCTGTGNWTTWVVDSSGRTILFDWELPGSRCAAERPGLVPGDQLPATPAIQGGGDRCLPGIALEAAGVPTEPWWDRQLALCLLGALVQFGWEKALGGYDDELAWWEARAVAAAALL